MRGRSYGLIVSDSDYRVVLDPSKYSKLIRLLLCEPPEPDALNCAMNHVVEPMGHFNPCILSLSLPGRNSEFCYYVPS